MEPPITEDLTTRISRLERKVNRLRLVSGLMIVGALVAGLAGAATASRVVKAQRFVVEDLQGRERAVLGLDKDGVPTLIMLNDSGAQFAEFPPPTPLPTDSKSAESKAARPASSAPRPKPKATRTPEAGAGLSSGTEITLFARGAEEITLAIDVDHLTATDLVKARPSSITGNVYYTYHEDRNYNQLEDYKIAQDKLGTEEMLNKGLAIRVTNGTKALIIDTSIARKLGKSRYKVRILDGENKGKLCWIPDIYVKTR